MNKRLSAGFTLIELLVVIAIIGILASIVMTGLGGAKAKSRDAKRLADIRSIQVALALYYNDNQMYPLNVYKGSGTAPNSGLQGTYMSAVPIDASASSVPNCANDAKAAGCYTYRAYGLIAGTTANCNGVGSNPLPNKYHIGAVLEDSGNSALLQDADAPVAQSGSMAGFALCLSGTIGAAGDDFDGTGPGSGSPAICTTTAGGTEKCFDMTP